MLALRRPDTQPRISLRKLVDESFLGPYLQSINQRLQEDDSAALHQSVRDSMWVEFMLSSGLSEEELELVIYAYSKRTCTFCGSNSAPLGAVHGASLLHRHRLPTVRMRQLKLTSSFKPGTPEYNLKRIIGRCAECECHRD
jgi:hypothetical protein